MDPVALKIISLLHFFSCMKQAVWKRNILVYPIWQRVKLVVSLVNFIHARLWLWKPLKRWLDFSSSMLFCFIPNCRLLHCTSPLANPFTQLTLSALSACTVRSLKEWHAQAVLLFLHNAAWILSGDSLDLLCLALYLKGLQYFRTLPVCWLPKKVHCSYKAPVTCNDAPRLHHFYKQLPADCITRNLQAYLLILHQKLTIPG